MFLEKIKFKSESVPAAKDIAVTLSMVPSRERKDLQILKNQKRLDHHGLLVLAEDTAQRI
jgi:hypothetical protein